MELATSIDRLKGLGPKTGAIFKANNIVTLKDLAYFFPRGWIDATTIVPINHLRHGMSGLIDVQVASVRQGISQRTRKPYLAATVADTTGSVDVMWFYATYLRAKVKPGA